MRYLAAVPLLMLLVGCAAATTTTPTPTEPSNTQSTVAASPQPNNSGVEPAAEDTVFFTADGPTPECPDAADLARTDQADESKLLALAPRMIKQMYTTPGYEEYTNLNVALAARAGLHGEMVKTWCGEKVADSTWVVKMTFPRNAPSASMSGGQFMVSKTRKGWQVWYRYH